VAVVNSDILYLTYAGIKTEFDAAYIKAQEEAKWKAIADEIPTTLPIQNYAWLGRGAVMQEFKDEAPEQSVREDNYTIADKIYKANIAIWRKSLEDDQYGILMKRARELASEAVRHWNQLAYLALANGFGATCYDGNAFFSASHSEGASGTQSNLTSSSLNDAALQKAESVMRSYVDDKGVPLEIEPDTLVVGPALARMAFDLTNSAVVVSRSTDSPTATVPFENYFQGNYKVIVSPYLINGTFNGVSYSSAYNWFLLDTKRGVKPIVIQSRQDVPITLETDMDQPSAKIKERFNVTVRGRYAQGYGLWQTAFGSSAAS